MPLYLGIPFTILLMLLAASLHVGRMSFEWAVALGGALWAAWQARKYRLEQFERLFPLEPLPLGVTVFFLFPITFPWFLRLRYKALRGRLPLRTRPSRLRLVLIGLVVVGGLVLNIGYGVLRRTAPWQRLEKGTQELQAATGGLVTYEERDGRLKLTIENAALYRLAPAVQRDTAMAIARKAIDVFRSSFGPFMKDLDTVEVRFIYYPGSRLEPPTESPSYRFAVSELAPARSAAPRARSFSRIGSASSSAWPTRPDSTKISVGMRMRTVVPMSGLL